MYIFEIPSLVSPLYYFEITYLEKKKIPFRNIKNIESLLKTLIEIRLSLFGLTFLVTESVDRIGLDELPNW